MLCSDVKNFSAKEPTSAMEDKTRAMVAILQILCLLVRLQCVSGACRKCPEDESGTRPVCGSDGRTYSSRCLLHYAKCKLGIKVRMAYKGKCRKPGADDQDARKFPLQSDNLVLSPTSKCLQDRQQALQNAKSKQLIMLGVFVPKCESDGSYSQVQCLDSSQFCWCVDKMGKEIHRTRVRGSRPRCPTLNLAHTKPSVKPAGKSWKYVKPCSNCKGCSQETRAVFNEKLVTFLSKEFMEYVQRPSPSSTDKVQGQPKSMEKAHLLLWKFTHLDANADYVLEMRELHGFLKKTKKTISPKKCSRSFLAYCDKDRNSKLSLNEWYICLGVKEIKKCTGDYLAALKSTRHSTGSNPYLPRCASDGSYEPTQCHYSLGYCWCVDVDTGKPIPNTTTKSSSLDCWKYTSKDNSTTIVKKQCAQDLWTSFKKHMIKLFRKEVEEDSPSSNNNDPIGSSMRNHERRSARSGDLRYLGSHLSDHQVLIWKFNRLDKNKDKLLLSSEFLTSAMKKHLGTIKRGRKCSKKLLNDCDLDKDRGLSILEWTRCLRTSRRIMPLQ